MNDALRCPMTDKLEHVTECRLLQSNFWTNVGNYLITLEAGEGVRHALGLI